MKTTRKLTLAQARNVAATPRQLARLIGSPVEEWAGNCHSVSLALLRTGEFGEGRIARGFAEEIVSQHSWIVLGEDVYDENAVIVDPTYLPATQGEARIVVARARDLTNIPHGKGSIWQAGKPFASSADYIELATPLTGEAKVFMDLAGPLDRLGWYRLANAPVQGWPAKEILTAIAQTPGLEQAVPIDILGMVTDLNPEGLYR